MLAQGACWLSVRDQQASGISHIKLRSCSVAKVSAQLSAANGSQTCRLHPLSVVHTLYMLIYTLGNRIRAGNSVFG